MLTIIITDKFPITNGSDTQLPCNSDTYVSNSNYLVVSLNNNTDGIEYLECLSSGDNGNTFSYQTMISTTSDINIDLADDLYSHVCSFGMF